VLTYVPYVSMWFKKTFEIYKVIVNGSSVKIPPISINNVF